MASIHKDPRNKSPFYYAAFYGPDGRRRLVSTKTRNRAAALRLAIEWEAAARKAREGRLYAAQARRILDQILSTTTGERLTEFSVESWFKQFLASKSGGASQATLSRYKQVLADFEAWLGARKNLPLAAITPGDLTAYRDKLRSEGRAISTCNQTIKKILSIPFEAARKLGYIPTNPAAGVDVLADRTEKKASGREPFTEIEIASLIAAAKGTDWEGMIILAATTGLRLGDAAKLTWGNINLETSEIAIETQKTGAELSLPIHPDFSRWLSQQPTGIAAAPVFPSLHGLSVGSRNGLSFQFRRMMEKAGIVCKVVSRGGAGRTTFSKGFHSLRHSFISRLANLGIPEEIRQKLAGHADAKTHAAYTHLEAKTLQSAIAKLPSIAQ